MVRKNTLALDANSNTTAENTKTYTFNQNNRLIKASEAATLGEYTFNANSQRATKTAGGSTTVYHHDQSGNLIAETTNAGVTVAEYIHLDGQPLAKADTGGTRYIHTDHLGTPQIMTGATGTVVWQVEAKPFGDGASITGSAVLSLRFPGQYFDSETGLNQNWWREYSTKIGRYVTPDPILLANPSIREVLSRTETGSEVLLRNFIEAAPTYGLLPQTYPYAQENPVNREDRSGLIAEYGAGAGIMYYYYQQMRQKNWIGGDKYYHCMASCKATWLGSDVAMNLGIGREVSDWLRKGEWDPDDWKANSRGLSCPLFQRCEDRCKPLAPPGML